MSVTDILTRVDAICKKYDKYDVDKPSDAGVSAGDSFARLYTVFVSEIDTAVQKSEAASVEKNRASVVAMYAEIRRTKARLLEELPKLQTLALKKVKNLSKDELEARTDLASALKDRIDSIPDGTPGGSKQTSGWAAASASRTGIIFNTTSEGSFDGDYFQQTEESSQFRQEFEMRKIKQDQGLDIIAEGLETLKDLAHDLNEELDRQVPLMDEIDEKVDKASSDLKSTNVRLKDTVTKLRSSRNFCIDIILLCIILGIAAYLYKNLQNPTPPPSRARHFKLKPSKQKLAVQFTTQMWETPEYWLPFKRYIHKKGFMKDACIFASLCAILFTSCYDCSFADSGPYNSFVISSFSYPETKLKPYEWRYIRVDLPPWFASMSMVIESDVDLDPTSTSNISKSSLPLICLREGSLPLPDFSESVLKDLVLEYLSNGSIGAIQGLHDTEHCYLMQKKITLKWTNEQITNGVWYFGLFNGIGAMRTQSKMIIRGSAYSFSANVSVEGCTTSNLWGPYCNLTINSLLCSQPLIGISSESGSPANFSNQKAEQMVSCRNFVESSCHGHDEQSIHYLEVVGLAEQLTISVRGIKLNGTSSKSVTYAGGIILMVYARYAAMPLEKVHDYSADINKGPLVIPLPKAGRWYIRIVLVNVTKELGRTENRSPKICYSLAFQVLECPRGKAGFNCSSERYALQTVLRKNPPVPFESYYIPHSLELSSDSANFPLEPLLSNFSVGTKFDGPWTYFVLDVPRGAAGGNMHIRLTSDKTVNYEIYARFDGLPSRVIRDYFYVNKTNNSDGSMFFALYNSTKEMVDFYISFVKEGTWSFAIRHLDSIDTSDDQTLMSISLERCPKSCSPPHGSCQNFLDESGLTVYSYCSCDRTHGGIDCSIEIISPQGHLWQSVSLVASNAAAILPAYWALRQKAFAEWVIFTSSGISSALYHACDVGTWCALTFRVLQFMDFWMSFMAVVSTFLYLAAIDEASRRAIHAAVSILTALMAISGATRSANIILVIVIGASGLLIGWLIELSTKYRSVSFPTALCLNVLRRRQNFRSSLVNAIRTLLKRFHWGFMLSGFVALAMAAASWQLETSQSYWIWHSVWHVSIYTASFLFLCSKLTTVSPENQRPQDGSYELTRQDSMPRG
ncbi:hypothetical protein Nepgr_024298 [Nepenthes gracilis]|uniref:t-SNARE coiled-coil homology domain-containing protein n=1 Tax=Nepenthes gracilis TaxID=150966 RepID=A0AAD3XZX5_NEPGR|nr:hypothetical protein Nepgr_024298 [Nepenthes gracilis]